MAKIPKNLKPTTPPKNRIQEKFEKVKEWALKEGIIGKQLSELPPGIEYGFDLRFAPNTPAERPIQCLFPKGRDCMVLQAQTNVGPDLVPHLKGENLESFLRNLAKYVTSQNLLHMESLKKPAPNGVYCWGILDEVYYEELTRPKFLRHFRKTGNASIHSGILFFEDILQPGGIDVSKFKPI